MISLIDENIGRLMDGLRSIGSLDDTLLIFTSDHVGAVYRSRSRAAPRLAVQYIRRRAHILMRVALLLVAGRPYGCSWTVGQIHTVQ